MKRIFPFFLAGILLLSFSAFSSETSGPDQFQVQNLPQSSPRKQIRMQHSPLPIPWSRKRSVPTQIAIF